MLPSTRPRFAINIIGVAEGVPRSGCSVGHLAVKCGSVETKGCRKYSVEVELVRNLMAHGEAREGK